MTDDLDRDPQDPKPWPGLDLDGSSGPALRRDQALLDALVTGALHRVADRPPWWRRKGTAPLVGVGIVVISTAAAAASGLAPRMLAAFGGTTDSEVLVVVAQPSESKLGRGETRPPAPDPVEPMAPAAQTQASAEQPALSDRVQSSDVARNSAPTPVREQVNAVLAVPPATLPATAPRLDGARSAVPNDPLKSSAGELEGPSALLARALDTRVTPEDLLDRASKLRKAQSYREALGVYELILSRYPGTRQAVIARVAAAQLELSQLGDAPSAQRRFREAEGDAELGPEALFGVAESCRAQGDVAGERKALRRLIQEHAESPLAGAARKRLAAVTVP